MTRHYSVETTRALEEIVDAFQANLDVEEAGLGLTIALKHRITMAKVNTTHKEAGQAIKEDDQQEGIETNTCLPQYVSGVAKQGT